LYFIWGELAAVARPQFEAHTSAGFSIH